MSERRFEEGLLREAGLAPGEVARRAAEDARRAIARWRVRVRVLGGATILLWSVVGACILLAVWFFVIYLLPKMLELATDADPDRRMASELGSVCASFGLICAGILGGLIALSAVATVAFVAASRSLTLGQIRSSLAEVLDELRGATGGATDGPS